MKSFLITKEQVQQFCEGSRDLNPLHTSINYARKTPFAKPVVNGVLLFGMALSTSELHATQVLRKITLDFLSPAFTDTHYQVLTDNLTEGRFQLRVLEGNKILLKATLDFVNNILDTPAISYDRAALKVLSEESARHLFPNDIATLSPVTTAYFPDLAYLKSFSEQTKLHPAHCLALFACGYWTGMHIPGRQALLLNVGCEFQPVTSHQVRAESTIQFESAVFDDRFGSIEQIIQFKNDSAVIATSHITALLRPEPVTAISVEKGFSYIESKELLGKSYLVIGGSRGLGAKTVLSLAHRGAAVFFTYLDSGDDALAVEKFIQDSKCSGCIQAIKNDSSNAADCSKLEAFFRSKNIKLDGVIFNASPSVFSLKLERETINRYIDFIEKHLRIVMQSYVSLIDRCNEKALFLLISTQALDTIPAEWPHYVAAKAALEATWLTLAKQAPKSRFSILRPPALKTDQMNTNLARHTNLPAEQFANTIVEEVIKLI